MSALARHEIERVATAIRPRSSAAPPASRLAFDIACDALRAAGAPVRRDREAAWSAFCETQSSYAALLASLAVRIRIGPGTWHLTARPRA